VELPPEEPMPPEKPPERGAETPLLEDEVELLRLALVTAELPVVLLDALLPEVTPLVAPPMLPPPLVVDEPLELAEPAVVPLDAPLVMLRLVTALPDPVPPARPLTADCTPVTRCAGGLSVSEALPPETRGMVVVPPVVEGGCCTTMVRGGS
jgi:hypothetical protein